MRTFINVHIYNTHEYVCSDIGVWVYMSLILVGCQDTGNGIDFSNIGSPLSNGIIFPLEEVSNLTLVFYIVTFMWEILAVI